MIRLTDEQWERMRDHFPEEHIADGRPGRKPTPTRRVLEAVLWILNTGAQWHMLPQSYPTNKTVHRRFQHWCEREVLRQVLADLANELRDRGAIDEREAFIDATFASATRRRGQVSGPHTQEFGHPRCRTDLAHVRAVSMALPRDGDQALLLHQALHDLLRDVHGLPGQ